MVSRMDDLNRMFRNRITLILTCTSIPHIETERARDGVDRSRPNIKHGERHGDQTPRESYTQEEDAAHPESVVKQAVVSAVRNTICNKKDKGV